MAKRRDSNIFSLSFLDIMACGFGAVILIYITINHGTVSEGVQIDPEAMAEVRKIERAIEAEKKNQITIKNTLALTDSEIVSTERNIEELLKKIKDLAAIQASIKAMRDSEQETVQALAEQQKKTEEELKRLQRMLEEADESEYGGGGSQAVTGLNMGGRRILILLDSSASMLDSKITLIAQRRALSEADQRLAPKWQRAIRIVEWIAKNIPEEASYQIIEFGTQASAVGPAELGKWSKADDPKIFEDVMTGLKRLTPKGGGSLHSAFATLIKFAPLPDNIFLITDGLPTQGARTTYSGGVDELQRIDYFAEAIDLIPPSVPINTILLPLESDPSAAPNYWVLGYNTGGILLTPAKDWPP
jgi:hypothetical protein